MEKYEPSEMDLILSPEALEIWKMLSETQKRAVQKYYPMKAKRDKELARLKSEGVPVRILMELSGLSKSAILSACKGVKTGERTRTTPLPETDIGRIFELLEELKQGQIEIYNAITIGAKG